AAAPGPVPATAADAPSRAGPARAGRAARAAPAGNAGRSCVSCDQVQYLAAVAATFELAGLVPLAHHRDAVAQAGELLDFGGDEQHRHALPRQLHHLGHDFLLGRDVDAAGGL